MSLSPGTHIGPYEIIAPLGEGGMGIVFRARDTQLLREVALKLLPEHFANDPDRLGRFQREAQVLAALNHPNIAQIYGFQQTGNSGAIVMELVDGETLSERLKRGPVPVDQAISIAKQIVDALEAAHKRGIVHRDLKPANIKLTPDGKVKVLDFGLAKALADEDPNVDSSNSPTMVSRSLAGVIMGTAAYMSPEQARGTAIDARTDIWAFGCVLYELLTSRPVFTGATVTDIIAKVIETQPKWELLPPETPFLVRTLLVSTLTKDRNERLQHIDDARVFLSSAEIPKLIAAPAPTVWLNRLLIAALAVVVMGAIVPIALYFLRTPEQKSQIRFELPSPGATGDAPSISPDGQYVAYSAQSEGKRTIWIRPMGDLAARSLSGTENGGSPFWSPDGRTIAFFADGKLKKISITGGPEANLSDTPLSIPGTWNRDGVILFSAAIGSGLFGIVRVPETGGTPTPVTKPQSGVIDVFPQFLPDGQHFLFVKSSATSESDLYVGGLDGSSPIRIMPVGNMNNGNFPGRYASGYLLFVRDRTLFGQRFDTKRLALSGEPVPVTEQVGPFWASEQDTLVYRSANTLAALLGQNQLLWIDRSGKVGAPFGIAGEYTTLRLSPDGHRVAADPAVNGNRDIWVTDLDRGISNRLTFDAAEDRNPRWSPDGKRILFATNRKSLHKMFTRSAMGIGSDEPVPSTGDADALEIGDDWSPDGKYIVFVRQTTQKLPALEIWLKPMTGDGKPIPYLQSKTVVNGEPRVSPNGKWLAYSTNESGMYQIVVQTFPDPTRGKWQASVRGGIYPTWRGDSRELYFAALDGKLMAVPVKAGESFDPEEPIALFQTPLTIPSIPLANRYDASADGTRFLFIAPATAGSNSASAAGSRTITAIVNWTAGLRKK